METAGHPYTRRFLGYLRKQREGTLEDYTTEPMAAKDEEVSQARHLVQN